MDITGTPLYLDLVPDTVAAFHHAPAAGSEAHSAVVIVPPFGWPEVASYRVRRDWAARLARRGHHVLRLDLPGTGDSAGSPRDPDRLGAWTAAVAGGGAWLRERSGAPRVAALGIGTGGVVAWLAAAAGGIDDLALWTVPARPRALVRELRAFAALASQHWVDEQLPELALPEGALEAAGQFMSAETVAALSALDLAAEPLPSAERRRILALGRDGAPPDPRLPATETADGPGYGAMTGVPDQAEFPSQTADAVDAWLAAAPAEPGPGGDVPVPATLPSLTVPGAIERPWTHETVGGRVFGVLASPAEPGDGPRLAVVLLNAGAMRRTGPNRMWTELARDWAARGVPVLRLDLHAIGDADGDTSYQDVARLYEPLLVDQARAAVAALRAEEVAPAFVVGGLCTGGYWTFQAMLEDPGAIQAALMINPYALFYERGMEAEEVLSAASQRLADPAAWRKLLRGGLTRADIAFQLRRAARAPLNARDRRRRATARTDRTAVALDTLRDADRRLYLWLGRDEPLAVRMEAEGLLAQLDRWPNLTLRRLPTTDHEFRPLRVQAHVRGLLDAALEHELERATTRPAETVR